MSTHPNLPLPKAVAHALGFVIAVDLTNRIVTVQFADELEVNHPSVRGKVLGFKMDLQRANGFDTNDWVVVFWTAAARRFEFGGLTCFRTEGQAGSCDIKKVEYKVKDSIQEGWFDKAQAQLRFQMEQRNKHDTETSPGLDKVTASRVLQIDAKTGAVPSTTGAPPDWLAAAVPMPQMSEEQVRDDSYVRIGYISFTLDSPMEEIQIDEAMPFDQAHTIRSRTPIQKNNWHREKTVTFSFALHGVEAINQIAMPLYRLFRRVPFLPVVNQLLWEAGITALALENFSLTTIPGFPNAMRCTMTCRAFNWESLLPMAGTANASDVQFNGLDAQFCYPMLKLWVEDPSRQGVPKCVPMQRWNGEFRLNVPSEQWLLQVEELETKKASVSLTKKELDDARQAAAWRKDPNRPKIAGFAHDPSDATKAGDYKERVALQGSLGIATIADGAFSENFQRFLASTQQTLTFYKVRSLPVAKTILHSGRNDLFKIIRGTPVLERENSQANASAIPDDLRASPQEIWAPYRWDEVDPDQLDYLLNSKDDPVSKLALDAGTYTFVFYADARIFNVLLAHENQLVQKLPDVRADEPVPDAMEVFENSSIVIEQISASTENALVPQQVRGHELPFYHYMGSNAVYYQVAGTIKDESDLVRIERFNRRITELARRFRGRVGAAPFGGFAIVENEFFQLLGTKFVIPMHWSVSTIPDFPGALKFEMAFVEFDITQRQKERVEDLFAGVGQDPLLSRSSLEDNVFVYFHRQQEFHRRLRLIEAYPDLALPLHSEIAIWLRDIKEGRVWDFDNEQPFTGYEYLDPLNGGTGWLWHVGGKHGTDGRVIAGDLPDEFMRLAPPQGENRFASPDFYCAPAQSHGQAMVNDLVKTARDQPFRLRDNYEAHLQFKPGDALEEKHITHDPQGTLKQNKDLIKEVNQGKNPIPPIGASSAKIDDFEYGILQAGIAEAGAISKVAFAVPQKPGSPSEITSVVPITSSDQQALINHYGPTAAQIAQFYGVPLDLMMGIIEVESSWNYKATNSQSTARGLGQMLAGTARRFGVTDPFDPTQNMTGVAKYLRFLIQHFHGDETLATAAYNAGEGTIDKSKPNIPNRDYVQKVLRARSHYGNQTNRISLGPSSTELNNHINQLLKSFNAGYGYDLETLKDSVIIPDPNDQNPERVTLREFLKPFIPTTQSDFQLQKLREEANKTRFIKPEWLITLYDDNAKGQKWVSIRQDNLKEFVLATKARGINFTLEKVPHRLDGRYAYQNQVASISYTPPSINQAFHDEKDGNDMFYDLRRTMHQGRLLMAFPTFYVAVIDGGRWLRIWRLYDHVYGVFAVTNISVHRTRHGPVETAVVGFSNMYGNWSAQAYDLNRQQVNDTRQVWNYAAVVRGLEGYLKGLDEETMAMWSQHLNSLMLKAGARLHVRMGYGSDISQLPVCFNGVITEVPVTEGEIQVVGLSDGLELLNDLPPNNTQGGLPITRITTATGGGLNPRELMMSFMAPNKVIESLNFAGAHALGANFLYFNFRNAYGIEHFGAPTRDGVGFDDAEIGVNVYDPEHSSPHNSSTAWDNSARILQINRWDGNRKLIGIDMTNARPWEIFETCRRTVPDYILYPMPFELRSTLFMGKGWFPAFFDYRDDLPDNLNLDPNIDPAFLQREALMQHKTFQQFHVLTSDWNLLQNNIMTDASQVYTAVQAVGTYNGLAPGAGDLSTEASYLMHADTDIFQEFQRTKIVESGLYTTVAMKFAEAGAGGAQAANQVGGELGAFLHLINVAFWPLSAVAAFFNSRRVMDTYAAMALKDSIKEMYQGAATILGDGFIKPYDFIAIKDDLSGMNGLAEVKEVTHTMSLQTGFQTDVSPDCIANYVDYEGQNVLFWLQSIANSALLALATAPTVGFLARAGCPYLALRAVRHTEKWLSNQIAKASRTGDKLFGKSIAELRLEEGELKHLVGLVEQAVKQKNGTRVRELLDTLMTSDGLKTVVENMPSHLRIEIQTQRLFRQIQGSGGALDWSKEQLGKLKELSATGAEKAIKKAEDAATKAQEAAQKAEEKLAQHGKSPKELDELRKAIKEANRGGKELAPELKAVAQDLKEFDAAARTAKLAQVGSTATKGAASIGEDLAGLISRLGSKVSKFNIFLAVFQIANIAIAEWLIRATVSRQCLHIMPLRMYQYEWSAGINGHRGAVYGDQPGAFDQKIDAILDVLRNPAVSTIAGFFIPAIVDVATADISYQAPAIPPILDTNVSNGR